MNSRKGNFTAIGLALFGMAAMDAASPAGVRSFVGFGALSAQEREAVTPPRNTQQEEAMFVEARRAMNAEDFVRAAELFAAIRTSPSGFRRYAPDAYYWEAFTRYRQGDLEEARILLETVMVGHEEAQRHGRLYADVRNLHLEIRSQLAGRGDADETAQLLREAEQTLDPESGFVMMPMEVAGERVTLPVAVADLVAHADTAALPDTLLAAAARQVNALMGDGSPPPDSIMAASLAMDDHARADLLAEWLHAQQESQAPTLAETLSDMARTGASYDQQTAAEYAQRLTGSDRLAAEYGRQMYQEAGGAQARAQEACEDVSVQLAALEALMRFDVNRMQILRGVLEREDDCSMQLHDEVVELIAQEETNEAEGVLLGVVQGHPETSVRRAAVDELWRFNSYDAYLELRSKVDAGDDGIRSAAVDGLGRSRYWATSPNWIRAALVDVATSEEAPLRLRQSAVYHLRRRDEVDGSHLISLYEELLEWDDSDDSDDMREYVLDQLGYKVRATGDEESAAWAYALALDSSASEGVRGEAFGTWAVAPSVNVAALAQLYRDFTEPFMRRHAIYAIYQRASSDPTAASTMIGLIRGEADPEVRERGIYWLGRTGAEEAVDFLLEFLPTTATDTIPPLPDGDGGR